MVTSSGVDDEGGGRDGSGPRGSGRPWDGRTSQRRDRDHVAPPRPRAAAIGTGPVTARVDAPPRTERDTTRAPAHRQLGKCARHGKRERVVSPHPRRQRRGSATGPRTVSYTHLTL